MPDYDAVLVVSFGGPEKREDVMPFLENVTRGRNVPRERLLAVAEHYYHFNGCSPINEQARDFIRALEADLRAHGIGLPVYWGNRNWHPMLLETVAAMRDAGVKRAIAYVTSAYSSWSGCRQYRENLAAARAQVGESAPEIDKIGVFYRNPGFIAASADRLRQAMEKLPDSTVVFTAHSIPTAMARGCAYEAQLRQTCELVAAEVGGPPWTLVYQSRSGPPQVPWLGPDILDHLRDARPPRVVIAPIGFLSDHMEILWDLDEEAREVCAELGIEMARAGTVGSHPRFVAAVRETIQRGLAGEPVQEPGLCSESCCLQGAAARPSATGSTG